MSEEAGKDVEEGVICGSCEFNFLITFCTFPFVACCLTPSADCPTLKICLNGEFALLVTVGALVGGAVAGFSLPACRGELPAGGVDGKGNRFGGIGASRGRSAKYVSSPLPEPGARGNGATGGGVLAPS
jgi:hypothetical protein